MAGFESSFPLLTHMKTVLNIGPSRWAISKKAPTGATEIAKASLLELELLACIVPVARFASRALYAGVMAS